MLQILLLIRRKRRSKNNNKKKNSTVIVNLVTFSVIHSSTVIYLICFIKKEIQFVTLEL